MNNPLVQVDPGLFIWTIVTFLVLLTLLAKFAWGPLLQTLEVLRLDGPGYRIAGVSRGDVVVQCEPFESLAIRLADLWSV